MKVLLLSCSTGEGHNSAAKAYGDYLVSRGVETIFKDVLGFAGKNATRKASDIYNTTLSNHLFGLIYKLGSAISDWTIGKSSPVYWANKKYCSRLGDYIDENSFDAIVCSHIFAADAVTELKRRGRIKVPTLMIMTDYTMVPFTKDSDLDWYLTPHADVVDFCVKHGQKKEKILPWGIPVRRDFYPPKLSRDEARHICKSEFGLIDTHKPWFLMMTGSMGYGNIKETVKEIVGTYKDSVEVVVVCGFNKKLKDELSHAATCHREIHVIGYTDKVSLLMDACDVLFTKPGGLSSTEAAIKNIP
ncbi:MAG: hypothetical protein ACI39U_06790, partial [Candidatus Cryptobacteroides sp.]